MVVRTFIRHPVFLFIQQTRVAAVILFLLWVGRYHNLQADIVYNDFRKSILLFNIMYCIFTPAGMSGKTQQTSESPDLRSTTTCGRRNLRLLLGQIPSFWEFSVIGTSAGGVDEDY